MEIGIEVEMGRRLGPSGEKLTYRREGLRRSMNALSTTVSDANLGTGHNFSR